MKSSIAVFLSGSAIPVSKHGMLSSQSGAGAVEPNISDEGLKAYYKFNEESGNILNSSESDDSLGSSAELVVTGATYNQSDSPTNIGYSMLFDGSNDYAKVSSSLDDFKFTWDVGTWSIAFWLKVDTFATNDVVFDTGNHADSLNVGALINLNGTSKMAFSIANGAGDPWVTYNVSDADYVPDTDWNFYCITYDQSLGSNNCKFYLNNSLHSQHNIDGGGTPSSNDADTPLNVARNPDPTGQYYDGYMTEVSWWDKILSTDDMETLYNSGNGLAIYG